MVNEREIQQYYKQNTECERLDIPESAMLRIVYEKLNIDYVISQRIKESVISDDEYTYINKADFNKSVNIFKDDLSYAISPRGGILINYSCSGAIEGTALNKNTVEYIMSVYTDGNEYDYSKVFVCVVYELNNNGIECLIENDRIKIGLNQFRSDN